MENDHCIFEFDDVISKEKCAEIIERFEKDPNKHEPRIYASDKNGNTTYTTSKKRKNGRELVIKLEDENEQWNDILYMILDSFLKKVSMQVVVRFCRHFEKYGEDPSDIENIWFRGAQPIPMPCMTISCTAPNNTYAWHFDEGSTIVFTGLLYLNDIDPIDGGATEFLDGRKVQPKSGKLLLFPASWSFPHRGSRVHVNKYTIAFGVSLADVSNRDTCTQ